MRKPTKKGWIRWDGVGRPVPFNSKVDVRLATGKVYLNGPAGFWDANKSGLPDLWASNGEKRIVAYRKAVPE